MHAFEEGKDLKNATDILVGQTVFMDQTGQNNVLIYKNCLAYLNSNVIFKVPWFLESVKNFESTQNANF